MTARRTVRFGRALGLVLVIPLAAGCGTTLASGATPPSQPPVLHLIAGAGADATGAFAAVGKGAADGGGDRYRVQGSLPTGPSHAPTYRLPQGNRAWLARLAAAFHLTAAPRRHAHGWVISEHGYVLQLSDEGQWSVQRADDQCPPYAVDVDSTDGSSVAHCTASAITVPQPGATAPPGSPLPAPSPEQLRRVAGPLLSALGLDPSAAVANPWAATLSVDPVVAGYPTSGYGTQVLVDPRGIRAANGWTYAPAASPAHTYPLISAAAALKKWASGPRPMMEMPAIACPMTTESPSSMPMACGGTLVVTGGQLGLTLSWDGGPGGHALLIPAWFLNVRGSEVPLVMIAVSPRFLGDPPGSGSDGGSGSGSGGSTGSGSTSGSVGGSVGGSTGSGGANTVPGDSTSPGPATP